jgi:toxin ParE1/3/4
LTESGWRIRLSGPAQADIRGIYRWTVGRFGVLQADAYLAIIDTALDALRGGPGILGARARPEVAPGLYTYHIARQDRRGRHFLLFRVQASERRVIVGRVLHEAMDLARHVPPDDER